MASRFPALMGKIGEREFAIVTMKLGEVAKQISYAERTIPGWEYELSPDMLIQRELNKIRVRDEIVPYLVENSDHFFGALTVELIRPEDPQNKLIFKPTDDDKSLGYLELNGTERLECLDGQHRLSAIEEAVKDNPELAKESIAVIVLSRRDVKSSQQLFSDLNRYAKPTNKALNILFEHRGAIELIAKEVARISISFGNRTNLQTNYLTKGSRDVITLAVLYECVKTLLEGAVSEKEKDENIIREKAKEIADIYDTVIMPSLPEFNDVLSRKIMPYELRSKYVYPFSVGYQAIAIAVKETRTQQWDKWEELIKNGFSKIDWRLENKMWEGFATVKERPVNRKAYIELTAILLKDKLGLRLDQDEKVKLGDLSDMPEI